MTKFIVTKIDQSWSPMRKRSALIRDLGMRPLFWIDFYGDAADVITTVPGGGDAIALALERRGVDPSSVFFTLWDIDLGDYR